MTDQENFERIVDCTVRDITKRMSGIHLIRTDKEPWTLDNAVSSLVTEVAGDYSFTVTCCADNKLLHTIAEHMKRSPVSDDEVGIYTTEYFNTLCGHVVSQINHLNQASARFKVPQFIEGPDNAHKDAFFDIHYESVDGKVSVQGFMTAASNQQERGKQAMKKKVMVVDDSRFIYEEMKYLLTDTEFEVVGYCKDGESSLQEYAILEPDIVTMDVILPGIDGFEAAERILRANPKARIVIVSSLAYDETMRRAEKIGIMEFVFKPLEKERVLEAMNKMLKIDVDK